MRNSLSRNPGRGGNVVAIGSNPASAGAKLVAELKEAGIQTATIASCFNGLPSRKTNVDLRITIQSLPREPAVLSRLKSANAGVEWLDFKHETRLAIVDMFAGIGTASRLIADLFYEAHILGEHRAIVLHERRLTTSWQAASELSAVALTHILQDGFSNSAAYGLSGIDLILRHLVAAASGHCPCLDDEGRPHLQTIRTNGLLGR